MPLSQSEETITITITRYKELLFAEEKLTALERSGVCHWEWYDEAMDTMSKTNEDE
jgi:hypothetical protein